MKFIALIFSLIFVVSCSSTGYVDSPASRSKAIETAILWEAELDSRWVPIDMEGITKNKRLFEKTGNFFKAKSDVFAFGNKVQYLGLIGVELYAGPSATVTGSPESVATYIDNNYGIKLNKVGNEYIANTKEYIRVIVSPHPSLENTTIVLGAYLGP